MNKWENIVVHCSDSEFGSASIIRQWHTQERKWRDIGYHYVILNAFPTSEWLKSGTEFISLIGSIECGRYLDNDTWVEKNEIGAHCLGLNSNSIGICLIGKNKFKEQQFISLRDLLIDLMDIFHIPPQNILGHYETDSGRKQNKTCPNFNLSLFRCWLIGTTKIPFGTLANFFTAGIINEVTN